MTTELGARGPAGSHAAIRELDAETIGQIAAGEVIERPLSVVKELVENAIDAGARRIDVRLQNGGADLIEVVDDGSGISPEDLPLAVRRHATSKLAAARDLESVGTLGFRGEGLASIAAVAQLEILSRREGAQIGARITAFGDTVGPVEPAAAPVGTRVRARDLFANVPVRREYLRSAAAEFGRVSAWLATFALAYPGTAFSLHHDGKEAWIFPQASDAEARLRTVFGKEAAASLIALRAEAADSLQGSVSGFISAPGFDRSDRRMQLLFVNGRLLRSTLLSGAWTAAYSTFAMTGRQPYGVLFLTLPPDHVDPNVHPTKSDVRLRYGRQVFDTARRAMTATLRAHALERYQSAVQMSPAPASFGAAEFQPPLLFGGAAVEESAEPQLRILGQLDAKYILASDGRDVVLVDQHAAHERVAYERIVAAAQHRAPSEPLLVPLTFELSAAQSAVLDGVLQTLADGGVDIEQFGERTYRLIATPAGYATRSFDVAGFIDDLTADAKQRTVHERVWASLACHSVVRAGERMQLAEMQQVVADLQQCANPMHCPHGRPTILRMDTAAIDKLFERI